MTTAAQRRRAYAAWVTIAIVWGTTYLAIKIALESVPPFLLGGIRYVSAGVALAAFVVLRGPGLPDRKTWQRAVVSGGLLLGCGNGGVVWAERWVPTGLTAVLVAATPFWMVGIEGALGGERMTRRSVIGLLVGFTGIVWLVWPELRASLGSTGSGGFALGVVALQVAALGWSLGSAYSRRHAPTGDPLGAAAAQMMCGGAIMLTAGTLTGEWHDLAFTMRASWALIYLSLVGSLIGFVCYMYALHHLPTAFVSLYAYINPIVAVALGVVVLGEHVGWRLPAAVATILAGTAIVSWRPRSTTGDGKSPAQGSRLPSDRAPSHDASSADQAHEEQHDSNHK